MQRQTMIYKPKTVFQLQITVFTPLERCNIHREKRSTHLTATDNVMAPVVWCTFVTHLFNSVGRADTVATDGIAVITKM